MSGRCPSRHTLPRYRYGEAPEVGLAFVEEVVADPAEVVCDRPEGHDGPHSGPHPDAPGYCVVWRREGYR